MNRTRTLLALAACAVITAPALAQTYPQAQGQPQAQPPAGWQGGGQQGQPGPWQGGGPGGDHGGDDHGGGDHGGDHGGGGWDLDHRIDWLSDRIDHAHDSGALSRRQYRHLEGELSRVRFQERRMRYHHHDEDMGGPDFGDLRDQVDHISDELHGLHDDGDRHPW